MTFTDKQIAELAKPLDPKHVKPPKKYGPKGDYIEGWHAIAEANRIFGFDGWSYTINLIRDDVSLGKDNDGNDQWQAAYSCICTVRAGDATREDVGFGSGFAKKVGDAIEGATKEAVTDALKRCLRTFGHPFGLALYDKDRANVQAPPPELPSGPITDKTRDWLQAQITASGQSVGDFCKAFEVTSLKAITYEQIEAAREWCHNNRKAA